MPGKSGAEEMPRLDAFDQEFGREPVAIARGHRRRIRLRTWALIVVALGAGVISALAVSWPNGDGLLRFELQSAAPLFQRSASREDSDEQTDRLRREVDVLKKEISDLTEAHRQAGETIAALQATEQEPRAPVLGEFWYSNLAALNFASQPQPRVVAPSPPRRPVTARPEPREPARRDKGGNGGGGAPLSLEAPGRMGGALSALRLHPSYKRFQLNVLYGFSHSLRPLEVLPRAANLACSATIRTLSGCHGLGMY